MKISIKKILAALLFLIVIILLALFIDNQIVTDRYLVRLDEAFLSDEELQMVADAHQIMKSAEQFWEGFEKSEIPMVLYNDKFEFLISQNRPDSNWTSFDSTSILSYYISKRPAKIPQSFGVKINDIWMGSIATRRKMNKSIVEQFKSQLPPVLNNFIPYNLFDITKDYHVVLYIHEAFHAYQGQVNGEKIREALNAYQYEVDYPFEEENQIMAWNKEGALLSKALKESDLRKLTEILCSWMNQRTRRRIETDLSADAIEFEKKLEWLEGLSFYVEMQAYKVAASRDEVLNFKYDKTPKYWKDELDKLKNNLGQLTGDLRFYLSGMAQAKILDKFYPEWKETIMEEGVFLEDIVADYLKCESE